MSHFPRNAQNSTSRKKYREHTINKEHSHTRVKLFDAKSGKFYDPRNPRFNSISFPSESSKGKRKQWLESRIHDQKAKGRYTTTSSDREGLSVSNAHRKVNYLKNKASSKSSNQFIGKLHPTLSTLNVRDPLIALTTL